jgi:hypothetical protein
LWLCNIFAMLKGVGPEGAIPTVKQTV